jgi:hypothetical protein
MPVWVSLAPMEEDRIPAALARIEAAARRIEAAAARQLSPPAPPPAADPDLAERHERLRKEAWAALAELDTLIETLDA